MTGVIEFTHKGWFGICPVYFADLDSDAPFIDPRHWLFAPLMWVSEVGYACVFHVMGWIDPEFEPAWPLRVTGELPDGNDEGA